MAKNNNLEDKILDQLEKILSRLNVSAEITAVSQEDGSLRFNIESADSSKFSNKPQSLSNLKPFERRIVHLTLENNPDVETRSEGEGRFRKLIVSPKA